MLRRKVIAAGVVLLLIAAFVLWSVRRRPDTSHIPLRASSEDVRLADPAPVRNPRLHSIRIEPANAFVAKGLTAKFSAFASYSDNEVRDVTAQAKWTSSTSVAMPVIDSPGVITGAEVGVSTVRAALGDVVAAADLTVKETTLVAISITPPAPAVAIGENITLTATGTYSDGTTRDITGESTWESGGSAVVVSDIQKGTALGIEEGTSLVAVKLDGVTSAVLVRVEPAIVAAIHVVPHNLTVAVGETVHFFATSVSSNGVQQDVTSLVAWESSNAAVLKMGGVPDERGAGAALTRGKVTVTAVLSGLRGTTALTVR